MVKIPNLGHNFELTLFPDGNKDTKNTPHPATMDGDNKICRRVSKFCMVVVSLFGTEYVPFRTNQTQSLPVLSKYSRRDATNPAAEAVISIFGTEDVPFTIWTNQTQSFQCCTSTQDEMPLILLQKLCVSHLVLRFIWSLTSNLFVLVRAECVRQRNEVAIKLGIIFSLSSLSVII